MDTNHIRELLDQRDKIDAELAAIFTGKERKPQRCSSCGKDGHNARVCPEKKE